LWISQDGGGAKFFCIRIEVYKNYKNLAINSCKYIHGLKYIPTLIKSNSCYLPRSRDSTVDMADRLWAGRERQGEEGKRYFSPENRLDRLWGPPTLLFNVYQGTLSPGVKWSWLEAE
jgi:hypothetical protein